MILKTIIDEDFNNYKKPAMLLGFPFCNFKCEHDIGKPVCHNSILIKSKNKKYNEIEIVNRYLSNNLTSAIVCGGLEPIDSFSDVTNLIKKMRKFTNDDIVIYTGYYENEISRQINLLSQFKNIIVKFGRFIPDQEKHFDNILGVNLASNNQYAKRIS